MADADKAKILVVDDLAEKLLVYQVVLDELGQEIVSARSGAEALKQVLQHEFAVILLDVNMPGMDGLETAALIRTRKKSSHTPIIFVTAFADEVRAAEGYAHGAVDYILSPIVPEVLRAKVKVFVDLFCMSQQIKRQADERIALADERMRREAAEEANRRLSFLASAGALLGQTLDQEVTARSLVKLSVPLLAQKAVVALSASNIAGWQVFRALATSNDVEFETGLHLSILSSLAAEIERVVSSGTSLFLSDLVEVTSECQPVTAILPLKARGRTFGALALLRDESRSPFGPSDIAVAEALASRAAIALENARLFNDIEHADRQKNEFLSMLAHELRNPLAPIRNAVDILRICEGNNEDVIWAREVIHRQVSNLVRLVDDLLDVSRITRGKIRLERHCLNVASVIANAVETSRPLIEACGHTLSVALPDEPIFVQGDPPRLAQVLANLLNNAAKYTPSGGSISLSVTAQGDQAVFRIRDTGVGIPAEMLSKVFDMFTQVNRSLDRSQGGLGIGLTLVQRLVEMHGGKVYAASEGPGRGSEFTISIPTVAIPSSRNEESHDVAPSMVVPSLQNVLVVDDNADAVSSLAKLLRLNGYQVHEASDGSTALEAAANLRPSVVMLDIGLPGIDGYEVARRLSKDPATKHALLIAVSGYGQESDIRRSMEAGFRHHLVKPVDVAVLLKTMATPDCSFHYAGKENKLQGEAPVFS